MTNVSVRERRGRIVSQTHREGHMRMEADIGVMLPQTEEFQESPESGRGREYSLLNLQRKCGCVLNLISAEIRTPELANCQSVRV